MMLDFPKPGGFTSLTTATPKMDSVPLGRVLRSLSDRLAIEAPYDIDETLEIFLQENERYANATRIASLSSPHALKAWAAERLPSLGLSYGFSNQVSPDAIQSNLDERGPLKLVEFADDLTMIASYCRNIEEIKIDAASHSHGLEFRFKIKGQVIIESRAAVESASIQSLLQQGTRENCLRKRIFATDTQIEAECIVLRKKVRLGFSPVD